MSEDKDLQHQPEQSSPLPAVILMPVISTVFGVTAEYCGLEGIMERVVHTILPNATPLGLLFLTTGLALQINVWLGQSVNVARSKFRVPWPWAYATKGDKDAVKFNLVQRAHQHFLEGLLPMFLSLAVAYQGGFPYLSTASAMLYLASRIPGSLGYMQSAKSRVWGMPGYFGLLTLSGLSYVAIYRNLF